jgi:hypothetical protein
MVGWGGENGKNTNVGDIFLLNFQIFIFGEETILLDFVTLPIL